MLIRHPDKVPTAKIDIIKRESVRTKRLQSESYDNPLLFYKNDENITGNKCIWMMTHFIIIVGFGLLHANSKVVPQKEHVGNSLVRVL